MLNGTLFSPFLLISAAQGLASGFLMYFLNKISKNRKLISLYGISLAGSAFSAFIQIVTTSLYLGKGTYSILPLMLIFSIFSGIFTAVLAINLPLPKSTPSLTIERNFVPSSARYEIPVIVFNILTASILCMLMKNIVMLLIILIFSFIFQLWCGRKIMILPHLALWIFVILCELFTPNGRVLYKLSNFSITEGALFSGISKSLKLSIISAFSQAAATIPSNPSSKSILSLTLSYFRGLSDTFRKTQGHLIQKIKTTLSTESFTVTIKQSSGITLKKSILLMIFVCGLFITIVNY